RGRKVIRPRKQKKGGRGKLEPAEKKRGESREKKMPGRAFQRLMFHAEDIGGRRGKRKREKRRRERKKKRKTKTSPIGEKEEEKKKEGERKGGKGERKGRENKGVLLKRKEEKGRGEERGGRREGEKA
ncbi:hypothetical protein, partial [Extibacter muris]|uniref:hypothetical protein n=1 Tax=Extibacter muris TaxID=1796622 RepID=UPI001912AE6F